MDDILDKLKVLDYNNKFCRDAGFPPLTRFYFMAPAQNPNEQFFMFTSLFSWLIHKLRMEFEPPGQFDDPNASAANIVNELKKLGVVFEYGPHKLKQGYGEAVLFALQSLVDRVLAQSGFVFQKPTHKIDDYPEEAEVDDDAEVTTDNIEEKFQPEEEEEEAFMDAVRSRGKSDTPKGPTLPPRPKVDQAEWKLEVERVAPMLRVQISNDNKDWRIHLEQMATNHSTIISSLSESKSQLGKLHGEIEKTLEKISSREKYINTQFESQIEEQRVLQDQISELRQKYNVSNSNVGELSTELARISEELDAVKTRMDEIGNGMTDSQPLVNIKKGMGKLKIDIKQMDLRIGVVEHSLLQAKLKDKGPMLAMPAFNPAAFLV
ncbi:Intraflagellar transport protein 57 [Chytriomyces hyalinus]|nr:intra-flagellar transport protein 57 [Chytriomyces cf. hyalinus JEL632]KAJ3243872.1 Intraflagellar transport protein 57 [Chytriomyces hyalinus]